MLKKLFFLIVIFFNSSSYADFNSAIKYIEEKNYDKAIELLIPLATKDNLEALFYLGLSYYEKENYSEALIWFEECAEEGDVYCQNNLGHMYDSGLGEEDKIKALYWFSKASMQDILPHPITSLANMYIEGEVVKQSYSKAFQLYEKAAARDFDRAIYALGLMYEKGEGTAHNYKKAKELYLKAFHLGHEIALFRKDALEGDGNKAFVMAEIYRTGKHEGVSYISMGIPIDFAESVFWYKIAEYKGFGDLGAENFEKVLDKIDLSDLSKASINFEIWKKNLGFEYDKETLEDVTPYFLSHSGTAFYVNSDYLITNRHITYVDDNFVSKCDKITGFNPYNGNFEVYKNVDTNYLPNIEDIDLLKASIKNENVNLFIAEEDIVLGDEVLVIGFPKAKTISKYPKISQGLVNSDYGMDNNPNQFISDAVSYGGSSGSPVYSIYGTLVGLLWGGADQAIYDDSEGVLGQVADPNISYVIKSSYIKKFLNYNDIEYKTSDNIDELKASIIAKNEIPNLRLVECYKFY